MNIRPLGSRILVRPDTPPQASDTIIIPDVAQSHVEMSGEVVALGDGPERDATLKRHFMKDIRDLVEECAETFRMQDSALLTMIRDELGRYGAIRPSEYDVKVGDRVFFPWNVGTKVQWDGEDYVVLTEDDPIAVFEEDEAAA